MTGRLLFLLGLLFLAINPPSMSAAEVDVGRLVTTDNCDIVELKVFPHTTTLLVGAKETFEAVGINTDGQEVTDIHPFWRTTGGFIRDRKDNKALYTATTSGSFRVEASLWCETTETWVSDTAFVTVATEERR